MNITLPDLTTHSWGRTAVWFPTVDSTNAYLKRNADDLPHGTVCIADTQTDGRGRLGRTWETPHGQALAMSVLVKLCADAACLPLVCGLAVARALTPLCGQTVGIKWPNDNICNGGKVCGILCEGISKGRSLWAVIGLGVNLHQTAEELARVGLPHAASLAMLTDTVPSAQAVAAAILNELEPLWQQVTQGGFAAIRETYAQHCLTLGREVRVLDPDGQVLHTGKAVDVTDDGCLMVRDAQGDHLVRSGEVSVRGQEGYV